MKIAQITDIHIGEKAVKDNQIRIKDNLERVLAESLRNGVELIIVTGDMGAVEEYGYLKHKLDNTKIDYRIVLGNHDESYNENRIKEHEQNYHKEHYKDCSILYLDSSSSYIDKKQFQWIEASLKDDAGKILIFIHHPVLDCGNTVIDKICPLENRDRLRDVLVESGKDIFIFAGHHHTIQETEHKNIKQYIAPSLAYQFKAYSDELEIESTDFGYRIIDILDGTVKTKAVSF